MAKKVFLTIPDGVYDILTSMMKEKGYFSIQEVINDIIRKRIFTEKKKSSKKRPFEFEDYFSKPTRESRKIEKSFK